MYVYKLNFTILELEIFSFLCIKTGEKLGQREIAKALNVLPTAVANTIKNLKTKNLITFEKTKTTNFISLNRNNHKATDIKRVENLKQIHTSGFSDFIEEKLAGSTIMLFGSYSKGEDTTKSDIDIAVIGRKNKPIDLQIFENILEK